MAKVKIVGTNLDENLNRENFNNTPSQTIFSFGRFSVTSNFDGRQFIDYSNELSTFVKPITLETLQLSDVQSEIILDKTKQVVLNLDKSDFKSFVRFGGAYEFLRVAVEDILLKYPASLYMTGENVRGGNNTFFDLNFDATTNITTFKVNLDAIVNDFGLIHKDYEVPVVLDGNEIKNLTLSYDRYIVWVGGEDIEVKAPIIGYTGNTKNGTRPYLMVKTIGNPFEEFDNLTDTPFHIKPDGIVFEEFRQQLTDFQKYILSFRREDNEGFEFIMKDPILNDNGNINYNDNVMVWTTSDGYNLDFNNSDYRQFLERLLTIGSKYDSFKTDLIARFLTPASIKTYDLTDEGKITKLLRVYGREFDQMREFIDSLAYINRVTYDKINNAPDQIIANLAKTMGWDYFSLVNEAELVETLLTIDDEERNLNAELLPAEIDIELWRRIIMNTTYFWKSKGTREAIRAMFLMIGIPEPFINITEYVYTVDGRIDPRQMNLQPIEFGSEVYPFDNDGYPKAPIETPEFYFQIFGNTDGGRAYMDNFRKAGFILERTVDNKKSWIQAGETHRRHPLSPIYYQADSKLVLNTKEVDVALDAAQGIEFDVYEYIKQDWMANSTGATLPYSYVNVSLDIGDGYTFPLPISYEDNQVKGDLEVRFNGILLNGPKEYNSTGDTTTSGTTNADYIVNPTTKTFTLLTASATTSPNRRDVIQATFLYRQSDSPISGVTVQYVVSKIVRTSTQVINLPSEPRGHVQLTINGIALTRGTSQFNADYVVNPNNSRELVIQNQAINDYLNNIPNSFIQVAYIEVSGSSTIEARNEIHRVDSFNSSKFYFNTLANRFVYRMNYMVKNVEDIKVLVDGIALEPGTDYFLNINNPFEVFLPRGIKFGTIISIYYLVGGDEFLNPVVDDVFGLGDISQLSFLQFLELAMRRMINACTRKTITDFKGGWYPTLLKIYNEYLKRAELEDDNPLQSNGYTFQNLFPFLRKYNSFFDKFITQLLSATIITRRSGLLVRNSLFSRQKFPYKRGVAFQHKQQPITFNNELNYVGDDGSLFLIPQEATVISPSVQTRLATSTTTNRINTTGGINVVMWNSVTSYGMEYRMKNTSDWIVIVPFPGPYGNTLVTNQFTMSIFNLQPDTEYEYRAFIDIGSERYYGEILEIKTQEVQIPDPTLNTIQGNEITNVNGASIIQNTGGINITRGDEVINFGMQYKRSSSSTWIFQPNPPYLGDDLEDDGNNPIVFYNFSHNITGLLPDEEYDYRAYVNVGGNNYYGNTITITTPQIPPQEPSVQTGSANILTYNQIEITNNQIISGNSVTTITKYGVIYTQNPSFSSESVLRYSGFDNDNIKRVQFGGFTTPYSTTISNLITTGLVWFRAFVIYEVGGVEQPAIHGSRGYLTLPTRTLNLNIVTDGNKAIDGVFNIVIANNDQPIEVVSIKDLVPGYSNEFILPNVDYYIDVFGIRLYDLATNQYVEINTYEWVHDNIVSFGQTSNTFTNPFHDVVLNVSSSLPQN